jgi:hypothetical protein
MGALNGHGNARGIATAQSVLASGGVGEVRLMSDAGRQRVLEHETAGLDLVLDANGYAPPLAENVVAALGQYFVGVTLESAARLNGCTISELNEALAHPEVGLIEPTSEWDSVDLLGAEFRETPDLLAGLVPVGVTLISAAPKVGKTRWLSQLSVAAVRGTPFLGLDVTRTKVLTLALEDGARRYRKSLHYLIGTSWPGRGELTIRTTSARLNEGGLTKIEQHLDRHPECRLVIIDVLARVRPRGYGSDNTSWTTTHSHCSTPSVSRSIQMHLLALGMVMKRDIQDRQL